MAALLSFLRSYPIIVRSTGVFFFEMTFACLRFFFESFTFCTSFRDCALQGLCFNALSLSVLWILLLFHPYLCSILLYLCLYNKKKTPIISITDMIIIVVCTKAYLKDQ